MGHLIYVNEAIGVAVDTDSIDPEYERVLRISYGPRSSDENMRCKPSAP
jgi:Zn-finger domain-containing protein